MQKLLPKTYYDLNAAGEYKTIVNRGGSRSGKTYSTLLFLIELNSLAPNSGLVTTIARKHLATLRVSTMFDFFRILQEYRLYNEKHHNKSLHTYDLFGNLVRFTGVDNFEKQKGQEQDILYVNEAPEFLYEDFEQMDMRTKRLTILDLNPNDANSWVRKKVECRSDVVTFVSTIFDNPFISERSKENILRRQQLDPEGWKIYGLGEYGTGSTLIYPKFEIRDIDQLVQPDTYNTVIGIDYGFNDPTAIVQITRHDGCYYVKLIKYGSGLSTDTIAKTITENNLTDYTIYFDSASPGVINDLKQRFGIYCKAPRKEVMAGILWCKQQPLIVDSNSERLIEDLQNYSWEKDRNGNILDKPDNKLHEHSHTMDAMRYAMYTEWRRETE